MNCFCWGCFCFCWGCFCFCWGCFCFCWGCFTWTSFRFCTSADACCWSPCIVLYIVGSLRDNAPQFEDITNLEILISPQWRSCCKYLSRWSSSDIGWWATTGQMALWKGSALAKVGHFPTHQLLVRMRKKKSDFQTNISEMEDAWNLSGLERFQ